MSAVLAIAVMGCDPSTADMDAGPLDAATGDGATPTCGGDDGTSCGDGNICVGGECVASTCGDGFVDSAGGEECEDGNETAFDGCEPGTCVYTCSDDEMCSDGEDCNGIETCGSAHVCVSGDPPGDSAACTQDSGDAGVCRSDECVPAGCGNNTVDGAEECDDGNDAEGDGCENDCTFSCESDADCIDLTVCNGGESCDLTTHACVAGTALECTASDACHVASCDDVEGCEEALIDEDGDGHASQLLGACGDDCQDNEPARYVGHEETCGDFIDNDCDTDVDETAATWYADCDADTYAATPTPGTSMQSCTLPSSGPSFCPGGTWTLMIPAGATVDCNDSVSAIYPGAAETTADGIDSNCDGTELCYRDNDGDGYRTAATILSSDPDCDDAMEASGSAGIDCNDAIGAINPAATEQVGDEVDQNCDGIELCFWDRDMDGYRAEGTASRTSSDLMCTSAAGEATASQSADDCDDARSVAHPDANELCDALDDDCDGAPRNTCPSTEATIGGSFTVSPWLGAAGANYQISNCPEGTAVIGFNLHHYASEIHQMEAVCRSITIDEDPGSPEYSYTLRWDGSANQTGGVMGRNYPDDAASSLLCGTDTYVDRVNLYHEPATNSVTYVQVFCRRVRFVRAGSSWVPEPYDVTAPAGVGAGSGTSVAHVHEYPPTELGRTLDISWEDPQGITRIRTASAGIGYDPQ